MSLLDADRRVFAVGAAMVMVLAGAVADGGVRSEELDGPVSPHRDHSPTGKPSVNSGPDMAWAVDAYEALRRGRGPATPELFVTWVRIGESYARPAEARGPGRCAELEPDVRDGYARYRAVWNGFRRAKRALEPPLEACVLRALATHYAHRVLRGLGTNTRTALQPGFVEALALHGDAARALGLMSTRDVAARWEMFYERVGGVDRSARPARLDPLAGELLARSVRYQLERALERFRDGRAFAAENIVGIAVDRLYEARAAGASRQALREVLKGVPGFAEALPGTRGTGTGPRTLADAVRSALAVRLRHESKARTSLAIRVEPGRGAMVGRGLRETVDVRGEPGRLTRERWLLEELDLLVRQVAGEPAVDEHRDLARLGSVLFYGLLGKVLGDRQEGIERLWRRLHGSIEPVQAGRALLAEPAVRKELRSAGALREVQRKLAVVDTPEIWADLGDRHVRRARALGVCSKQARPVWRAAGEAFEQAWRRSHPEHPMRASGAWRRLQQSVEALARGEAPICSPGSTNGTQRSRETSPR